MFFIYPEICFRMISFHLRPSCFVKYWNNMLLSFRCYWVLFIQKLSNFFKTNLVEKVKWFWAFFSNWLSIYVSVRKYQNSLSTISSYLKFILIVYRNLISLEFFYKYPNIQNPRILIFTIKIHICLFYIERADKN